MCVCVWVGGCLQVDGLHIYTQYCSQRTIGDEQLGLLMQLSPEFKRLHDVRAIPSSLPAAVPMCVCVCV
jgi:hypothetical protein